jgi:hypothetical protein
MSRVRACGLSAVVVAVLVAGVGGCRPAGLLFYDVTRTRTEQCSIRSDGRFCVEPEQFAAPVTESWGVEFGRSVSLLYVDEQVRVLEPIDADDDPYTAVHKTTQSRIVSAGAAQCTTTTAETITFIADGAEFTGTLRASTKLEGPSACGATPVGEDFIEDLAGVEGTP